MEIATHRLVTAVEEYLNDIQGRQHLPISTELVDKLNGVAKELSSDESAPVMTPGERQAQEASVGLTSSVRLDPTPESTPGERAALDAVE